MFSEKTKNEIIAEASKAHLEPAGLLAVAEVESGGQVYAQVNGRSEPLIRFEGHYFHHMLKGEKQIAACNAGLASPRAGGVPNPRTQEGRWKLLNRAAMIDREAAYKSTSWGLGQVMGTHWQSLGYLSVHALVRDARSGAGGQARLMISFIKAKQIDHLLERHDWDAFARIYNGPDYARGGYHLKLASAYQRYARNPPLAMADTLRIGSSGPAVTALQGALSKAGFPVDADGRFGRATAAALIAFQEKTCLSPDGIAGPATMKKLAGAPKLERKSHFSFSDALMWLPYFSSRR